MLSFLQKFYKALDEDSNSEIAAFYTDFSKAYDKEPHFDLLCKVACSGRRLHPRGLIRLPDKLEAICENGKCLLADGSC